MVPNAHCDAHVPLTPCFLSLQVDFRDYPPLLRQAVSIARKIQDPLIEYSQVCSSDEDILCLKLHPLQVRHLGLVFVFYHHLYIYGLFRNDHGLDSCRHIIKHDLVAIPV